MDDFIKLSAAITLLPEIMTKTVKKKTQNKTNPDFSTFKIFLSPAFKLANAVKLFYNSLYSSILCITTQEIICLKAVSFSTSKVIKRKHFC